MQLASLRDEIMPLELAISADPELSAQRRLAMEAVGPALPPGPPQAVAAYLAAEQGLGRVRRDVDPQEAAMVLLAVLFALGTMPTIGEEGLNPDRVGSAVRLVEATSRPRDRRVSPHPDRTRAGAIREWCPTE